MADFEVTEGKPIDLRKGFWKTHSREKQFTTAIMISELIDNSLSSWLANNDNNPSGLKVEIHYEFGATGKDDKLIITDNAYGVPKDQIQEILTPGVTNKKSTKLSVYGVGLKDASFWSGETLTFKSKPDFHPAYEATLDLSGEPEDQVRPEIRQLDDTDGSINYFYNENKPLVDGGHGSQIILENLYDERDFSSIDYDVRQLKENGWQLANIWTNNGTFTIPTVAFRFKKWIQRGMTIVFSSHNFSDDEPLVSYEISPSNIKDTELGVCNPHDELSDFLEKIHTEGKALKLDYKKSKSELEEILKQDFNSTPEDIEGFFKKLDNRDSATEIISLNFPSFSVPLKLAYFPQHMEDIKGKYNQKYYSKYRGVYMYQMDRAVATAPNIYIPGGRAKALGTFDSPIDETGENEGILIRRMWGEMDIDQLIDKDYLELNVNKIGINMNPTESKGLKELERRMKDAMRSFGSHWAPLILAIDHWEAETRRKIDGLSADSKDQNSMLDEIASSKDNNFEIIGAFDNKTKSIVDKEDMNKPEFEKLLRVIKIHLDSSDIFFTFKEVSFDDKDVYPYRYSQVIDVNNDKEIYSIEANPESTLFIPKASKVVEDRKQNAYRSQIQQQCINQAVIETLFSIYINASDVMNGNTDMNGKPEWVKELFNYSPDSLKIKEKIAEAVCGGPKIA